MIVQQCSKCDVVPANYIYIFPHHTNITTRIPLKTTKGNGQLFVREPHSNRTRSCFSPRAIASTGWIVLFHITNVELKACMLTGNHFEPFFDFLTKSMQVRPTEPEPPEITSKSPHLEPNRYIYISLSIMSMQKIYHICSCPCTNSHLEPLCVHRHFHRYTCINIIYTLV